VNEDILRCNLFAITMTHLIRLGQVHSSTQPKCLGTLTADDSCLDFILEYKLESETVESDREHPAVRHGMKCNGEQKFIRT